MNFIKIVQAAESSVVSCTGNDCGICSLMETVSNIYNFFLGVCFAVAVLVLVIAGVSYLINSGNRNKIEKSLYLLKSGIIGFSLILLGWVVVHTIIKTVGYQNAGGWWEFQCTSENNNVEKGHAPSLQGEYYKNLKTYPDISAYLKSGAEQAKIKGPMDALSLSSQLKSLKDGEALRFLAPVRSDSMNGIQDLFLPLLTVSKSGENLKLDSTGEYWNLIQNMYPKFNVETGHAPSLQNADQQLLNKLLGTNSFTDNRSLVDGNGNSLDDSSSSDFASLYKTLADSLGNLQGDRSQSTESTDLSNMSLSELIALAGSYSQGDNPSATDKMIGDLTSRVLKLVSTVMVEKGTSSDGLLGIDSQCQDPASGGWIKNGCNKDDDGDKVINGEDHCPNTPSGEKGQVNKTKGSKYKGCSCSDLGSAEMQCPPDQCVGDNWVAYPTGSQTCQNGQLKSYSCEPASRSYDEKCVDSSLTGTGTGTGETTGSTGQNFNTNSSNPWTASSNNPNNPFKSNNTGQQTKSASTGSKSGSASKAPNKTNSGNKSTNPTPKDPTNPGPGGIGSTNEHGSPLGVKAALKRIYERDKLRYLMVFKYVNYIEPSGGGGITWSHRGGVIGVNFYAPVKYLDQVIVHETTHRADFAYDGWFVGVPPADAESIAVANEVGSTGRIKESPGQKEEVKVLNNNNKTSCTEDKNNFLSFLLNNVSAETNENKDNSSNNDRLEARGYNARWLDRDVDPKGDMNPTDIGFAVSYAKENGGGRTGSNTVYGWPPGGEKFILRVNDFQENRVRIIMDGVNKRSCMSRPSDDMPQLTTENGYTEDQLNGCKEAKPIRIAE